MAEDDLFVPKWSVRILDELLRNLSGVMQQEQIRRLEGALRGAFPDAWVEEYDPPGLENHPKDRHVVATALKCGASHFVTFNLKDFSPLPTPVRAVHPEPFLSSLFDAEPELFLEALRRQASRLRRPPHTLEDLLARLDGSLPGLIAGIRRARESARR